jgi:hypothetical protein
MLKTEKKAVRVGKLVNTDHVNTAVRNYKKERWIHNSRRLGKEDSLSVWYSVEELEEFLATSKAHGADGIRMYFGAYDKNDAPKPEYVGRQTIVLVATKLKETLRGSVTKDIYVNGEEGTTILAYNMGHLCPPFCTTSDDGGGIGIGIIDKGNEGMVIA